MVTEEYYSNYLPGRRLQQCYDLAPDRVLQYSTTEIDYNKTKNGIIHCKDGFTATTFNEADFKDLCAEMSLAGKTFEVDNSSIFCEVTKT
ncbi:hypothetical protein ACFL46_03295 [Candidatus Neomarinimicrobiota bacterium]